VIVKKIGFILMALVAIVVGLLVGTLNSGPVQLDLLWFQLELPLGLVILLGFSLGVITGLGMLYLARVLPLQLQLRKARATLLKRDNSTNQDIPGLDLPDD
jgi:putative membrane protein